MSLQKDCNKCNENSNLNKSYFNFIIFIILLQFVHEVNTQDPFPSFTIPTGGRNNISNPGVTNNEIYDDKLLPTSPTNIVISNKGSNYNNQQGKPRELGNNSTNNEIIQNSSQPLKKQFFDKFF
ncbi:hypothetical protein RhiirA5_414483 [Rhizophagus irregularis]|uniref:Uncharacterized protein n=1 Tax=Rhizophagus irregularis TaxID=588596 RepID=A0A2I1DWI1_9GLOM|nr:hypothetical protein RhiirA5_414483 [Rhizophagus irregularis]PKC75234.1 hypothetical protein RhiirA1_448980 [Rhizophagus irregularis]PKY14239.1 hypothetical protein RhiirB3_426202 [Rhizophagus irregularis]